MLEAVVTGLAAKRDAAPDYSETLGESAALLEKMRTATNGFARTPAMQLTPDAMAAEIAAAGSESRTADSAAIEKARVRFDSAAYRVEQLAGRVATIRDQHHRLLWEAGTRLMRAGSLQTWQAIVDTAEMRSENQGTIDACERKARRPKQPERCTVRVRARSDNRSSTS